MQFQLPLETHFGRSWKKRSLMPDSIQKDIILTIQEGGVAILRDSQSISFFGYFRV